MQTSPTGPEARLTAGLRGPPYMRGTATVCAMADAPRFDCEQLHPTLPVRDVLAAVDFYTKKLGFNLGFIWGDPPTLAGVNLGETHQVQIFLAQGEPHPAGCSIYVVIGERDGSYSVGAAADELFEFQRANGVDIVEEPGDRPWGLRDFTIRDLHGYQLSFGHRLLNAGPPLKIERVDVRVRLEKRLAALLRDLAAHKRMSIDSCLEEILLHTSEPLGDGIASPHTKRTLEYIQELKRRHGIDYDCHASYRFVEG
jgi:catechol 2,3-dioxygenase-like lactoylglutathione lyase family enzyme